MIKEELRLHPISVLNRKRINKIADGFLTQTFPLENKVVVDYINIFLKKEFHLMSYKLVSTSYLKTPAHFKSKAKEFIDTRLVVEKISKQLNELAKVIHFVYPYVNMEDVLYKQKKLRWDMYFLEKIKNAQVSIFHIYQKDIDSFLKVVYMNNVVESFYRKNSINWYLLEKMGVQLKRVAK